MDLYLFSDFFDKSFIGISSNKIKLYKSTNAHPCSWTRTNKNHRRSDTSGWIDDFARGWIDNLARR